MNMLFVLGKYDDNGGRQSLYGDLFYAECCKQFSALSPHHSYTIMNGGKFDHLYNLQLNNFDVIFWFADVPNDKPKIVNDIKKRNQTCMLVTSKRNDGLKYDMSSLISRMLKTKSNLLVELTKCDDHIVRAIGVYDPLGNCYARNAEIKDLVSALVKRLSFLRYCTRVQSVKVGDAIAFPEVPWCTEYIDIVRHHANMFSTLVPAVTERFLGNTSFRCSHGFPSMRYDGTTFVSRRNIDKTEIGTDGFVAVKQLLKNVIAYYGDHKPSVDAPVQIALYDRFAKINFMIHGHAYITDGVFTSRRVPCGAMQEVDDILEIIPQDATEFCVNLLGHGSICAAENLDSLRNVKYYARQLPELAM